MIGIALVSCSNVESTKLENESLQVQDMYLLSKNSALENAEKMFSILNKKTTRSARPVATIDRFQTKQSYTRGSSMELSNRGFYIINYGNNDGFAIVSADKRDSHVYAISEEGHINLSDTLQNSGLNWYLNDAMPEMSDLAIKNPIDTTTYKPIDIPWYYNETLSEPLLKGFMSQFHQLSPYNKYCNSGAPYYYSPRYVGCGPLAVGTIMGYFKWPNAAEGTTFQWDQMHSNRYDDGWSRLFEIVGRQHYLNSDYSNPLSTGTSPANYIKAFRNMGYINQKLVNFSTTLVGNELKSNKPVLCRGNHKDLLDGHAWVIDGGYVIESEVRPIIKDEKPEIVFRYYFNCVWGWNGSNNGYFQYYSNTKNLDSYEGLQIVYGFTPNK